MRVWYAGRRQSLHSNLAFCYYLKSLVVYYSQYYLTGSVQVIQQLSNLMPIRHLHLLLAPTVVSYDPDSQNLRIELIRISFDPAFRRIRDAGLCYLKYTMAVFYPVGCYMDSRFEQ